MKYHYITETKSEKRSESKLEKSTIYTIIITAVITALLTGTTQFFLQESQLSNEHEYWKTRYNIENVQSVNNVRLKIMEDISNGILQLEVQAKEIKILKAAEKYSSDPNDMKKLNELLIQYHKDLYKVSSKMEIASIYFDKKVDDKLLILGKALSENFQNNLITSSRELTKLPEFELDFETIDKLPKIKKEVFEEMLKNMNEDFNNIDIK